MRYKVIHKVTGNDITNQEFWVITPYGDLRYLYYDSIIEHPDAIAVFEDKEIEKHLKPRCDKCFWVNICSGGSDDKHTCPQYKPKYQNPPIEEFLDLNDLVE